MLSRKCLLDVEASARTSAAIVSGSVDSELIQKKFRPLLEEFQLKLCFVERLLCESLLIRYRLYIHLRFRATNLQGVSLPAGLVLIAITVEWNGSVARLLAEISHVSDGSIQ